MRRTPVLVLMAALLAACTNNQPVAAPGAPGYSILPAEPHKVEASAARPLALETFTDCARLKTYLKKESAALADAERMYADVGIGDGGFGEGILPGSAPAPASADAPPPPPQFGPRGDAASFSTTNVQEKGVDEPDSMKTDGDTLFTVVGTDVLAVAVGAAAPRILDTYSADAIAGGQLLLAGDRLLVLTSGDHHDEIRTGAADGSVKDPLQGWRQATTVTVLDVANPRALRLARKVSLEGSIVSARLVGGVARIVLRTYAPTVELVYPQKDTLAAKRTAERKNRRAFAALDLGDWLPKAALAGPRLTAAERRPRQMVPCERVHRPRSFSGLEMVSVLSLDPSNPRPAGAATVVGVGETVYASTTSVYVTTNAWDEERAPKAVGGGVVEQATTKIHRFDITDATRARYASSGTVPGHVLNQWSLSEHEGTLRVATTLDLFSEPEESSESHVTMLRERAGLLARVGRITGLGKTERIYGVRFIGDLGYVVTFRQIDPLYVLDLSNPARPRVRGELKISGYSAYLHPVDDGRLLGVGTDADAEGRRLGAQATVFDVSDPAAPRAVDRRRFEHGSTSVEHDHHAFLWWSPERLAVFPLSRDLEDGSGVRSSVVGLEIGDTGSLQIRGSIEHPSASDDEGQPEISRALVVGGTLYTLSYAGLGAADLDTFRSRSFLRWPAL